MSFDTPAQNQIASCTALQPAIQFAGEQEADDHGEVMLDARGEQDRLVGEPAERQQHDDRQELRRADRRRHERAQQRRDERRRRARRRASVRVVPPNSGRFGNGASLIVPGRRKCRNAVNGGQMWKPSGPLMQPKPSTSTRQAQMKAFWKAMPSSHHEPNVHGLPRPGVKLQKNIQPSTKRQSLTAWKTYAAIGRPIPWRT